MLSQDILDRIEREREILERYVKLHDKHLYRIMRHEQEIERREYPVLLFYHRQKRLSRGIDFQA